MSEKELGVRYKQFLLKRLYWFGSLSAKLILILMDKKRNYENYTYRLLAQLKKEGMIYQSISPFNGIHKQWAITGKGKKFLDNNVDSKKDKPKWNEDNHKLITILTIMKNNWSVETDVLTERLIARDFFKKYKESGLNNKEIFKKYYNSKRPRPDLFVKKNVNFLENGSTIEIQKNSAIEIESCIKSVVRYKEIFKKYDKFIDKEYCQVIYLCTPEVFLKIKNYFETKKLQKPYWLKVLEINYT